MHWIDYRSDTITKPTPEMRKVMAEAEVGDDVFGDDPTVNRLQERVAELTGKEAALFVPSGTMGNQISLNAHTQPGQEVIVEADAHIFYYECGAPGMLSGVQLRPLSGKHGVLTADQIAAAIRPPDVHQPQTSLICLENTHNRAGGTIYPLEEIQRIARLARDKGIKLHLDGARLWNAAVATGISLKEWCEPFDSVSLCFSKGLGAPIGSIVVGSRRFIERAHYYRKAYGGGMRQVGIIAAGALYAVEHHFERLADDHRHARQIAEALVELPGIQLNLDTVQTNIIIFELNHPTLSPARLVDQLNDNGILIISMGGNKLRIVTHLHITDADVEKTIAVFRQLLGNPGRIH